MYSTESETSESPQFARSVGFPRSGRVSRRTSRVQKSVAKEFETLREKNIKRLQREKELERRPSLEPLKTDDD